MKAPARGRGFSFCTLALLLFITDYIKLTNMLITEMRTWFDILQDKTGDPYFTDDEKDEFLEDAQWDIINEIIGDYQNSPIIGANKTIAATLAPLVDTVSITTAADGKATHALINAQSTLADNPILILAINPASGGPANFNNYNDIFKAEENTYKQGTSTNPNYTLELNYAQLYPAEAYTGLKITSLHAPALINDLPVNLHRKQVAKAMTKTGLVTEDQALTLMEQTTNG